jgi:hypothetical protein
VVAGLIGTSAFVVGPFGGAGLADFGLAAGFGAIGFSAGFGAAGFVVGCGAAAFTAGFAVGCGADGFAAGFVAAGFVATERTRAGLAAGLEPVRAAGLAATLLGAARVCGAVAGNA